LLNFFLLQDALGRLQSLEAMGRLNGIMDDRGKFIYLSEEVGDV
jgi:hypothetical protein